MSHNTAENCRGWKTSAQYTKDRLEREKHTWIGVDFDGTLAEYHGERDPHHVGAPIMPMIETVRGFLARGCDVRIFTSRVHPMAPDPTTSARLIQVFCLEHFNKLLPITYSKDPEMSELWDDRAIGVRTNTGEPVLP
jgi:hypothetical protein